LAREDAQWLVRPLALVVAFLLASLAGRAEPQQSQAPTFPSPMRPAPAPANMGVIVGQVVDATNSRPVAKAIVRLSGRGVAQTRLTDDKGRYYFVLLPAGDFSITATKPGFLDGAYGRRRAAGSGIPLTLFPSQWVVDAQIELFRTAAISGSVVDENNEPLVGLRVRMLRREFTAGRAKWIPSGEDTTDDEGMYRVFNLTPGEYLAWIPSVQVTMPVETLEGIATTGSVTLDLSALMTMSGPPSMEDMALDPDSKFLIVNGRQTPAPPPDHGREFAYPTEYYPAGDRSSSAVPITVGPGEHHGAVNFQLQPVQTTRVSGVVVGPLGPVAGQMLRLMAADIDDLGPGLGSETAATITMADGAFMFLNVPVGDYTIQARRLGSVLTSAAAAAGAAGGFLDTVRQGPVWGDALISVGDKRVDDVVVTMQPGATIAGRVVFEGAAARPAADQLSRLSVGVEGVGGAATSLRSIRPDASGRFELSDLVPGRYVVRVTTSFPGWYFKTAFWGGVDMAEMPLDVTGNNIDDVVVTFSDRPTRLSGTVRDIRGIPVPGATIIVLPPAARGSDARRTREARADVIGLYTIEGLPPGDYDVVAIDDRAAEGWQDPRRIEALRRVATRVSIRDAERKTIDLRVGK
jgi:hypothetical protein